MTADAYDQDEFSQYDAAYVLGALSPDERLAFERHLEGCAACAAQVRDLAGMPGLLGSVPLEDVLAPYQEPPPASLLPALARAAHQRQRRRRWGWTALAALGAAAAAAGAVAVLPSSSAGPPPPQAVATAPAAVMAQVTPSPVHASVHLADVAWGTRIDLTCTYDQVPYGSPGAGTSPGPAAYALVVTDRAGATQQVGTWRIVPGRPSRMTGATEWRRSDIASVEVRTVTGTPLLRLTL